MLLFGSRVVIPASMRKEVLEQLHLGHFGMQRMKQLARTDVYWSNIDHHNEGMCRQCISCGEHQNKPLKPAVHPWMLHEKLGAGFIWTILSIFWKATGWFSLLLTRSTHAFIQHRHWLQRQPKTYWSRILHTSGIHIPLSQTMQQLSCQKSSRHGAKRKE